MPTISLDMKGHMMLIAMMVPGSHNSIETVYKMYTL